MCVCAISRGYYSCYHLFGLHPVIIYCSYFYLPSSLDILEAKYQSISYAHSIRLARVEWIQCSYQSTNIDKHNENRQVTTSSSRDNPLPIVSIHTWLFILALSANHGQRQRWSARGSAEADNCQQDSSWWLQICQMGWCKFIAIL